jgi:Asp-tRNA(Asn)/Glu-tRNA(Gln) amidotransferase A subunit family amidase
MNFSRWHNPNAVSFSRAVADFQSGRDTPSAMLERCLSRISERDGEVRAFVRLNTNARHAADAATARYRRGTPLSAVDGCPVGIKDIMDTADMPTEMGSPAFAGWQPAYDAACVQALRAGGAVIVGKTATTAFACGGPAATTNPFDARRTPGGSSSGSGAAVGSGMLPVALGTQTQGSILRPASYCGAVGFKPTHGVLDMISMTHDHLGVLAGTLDDAWRIASHLSLWQCTPQQSVLDGASVSLPAPLKPRKLMRLYTRGWEQEATPATRAAFDAWTTSLSSAGVEVLNRGQDPRIAKIEAALDDAFADRSLEITACEMRWPYEQYIARHGSLIEPRVHERMAQARGITPQRYAGLLSEKSNKKQLLMDMSADCDGFITLSSSGPAPVGLQHTGSRTFLTHASYLGLPAFSLPLLVAEGMPLGLQLIGKPYEDGRLCAMAAWMMGLHAAG